MVITIEVTQKHIDDARRFLGGGEGEGALRALRLCWCPIALAVRDRFKLEPFAVSVWPSGICIRGAYGRTFSLPWSAQSFINAFDNDEEVAPFSFVLHEGEGL